MKITAITATVLVSKDGVQFSIVYGLGEDNNIYRWNYKIGEWFLDKPVLRTAQPR